MKKKIYSLVMLFLTQCTMSFAENTDISNLDNIIYIESFTLEAGTESSISLKMKNTAAIRSFGFDLYLPEGITAVPNSSGNPRGSLNYDRVPKDDDGFPAHKMTLSFQEGNVIRFLCDAQEGQTFIGNEGEIATLRVNVAATMAKGDYPVIIRTMKLSETDIANHYDTDYIESTVTITGTSDTRTVLDETSTTAPTSATNVDVRVKRTINANEWSTICLPFAMTEVQMKECFGNDVKLADFTSWTSEVDGRYVVGINVNFETVTAIKANHPYIIKVSAPITEFTVDGVNIEPVAEPVVQVGATAKERGWFHGTYAVKKVPEENLFLSGNKFWYSTGATTIKGYRGYFKFRDVLDVYYDDYEGSEVKVCLFVNGADGIGSIAEGHLTNDNAAYNLAGQRVSKSYKGIVIEKGKKIIK